MGDESEQPDPKTRQRPIPFSRVTLAQAGYAVGLISIGLSLDIELAFWSVLALLIWKAIFSANNSVLQTAGAVVGFAILYWLASSLDAPRPVDRTRCRNNIRQLSIGILNYESAYNRLPNSEAGPEGFPHSWRIKILPYIEHNQIYMQYNFDEPWDGPNNRKLANQMPDVFRCPSNPTGNKTPYKIVRGSGTAFETEPGAINWGTDNSIMIVEDVGTPANWMSPDDDLSIDDALILMNKMTHATCAHQDEMLLENRYYGLNFTALTGETSTRPFLPSTSVPRSGFLTSEAPHPQFESYSDGESSTESKPFAYLVLAIYWIGLLLPAAFLKGVHKPSDTLESVETRDGVESR